MGHSIEYSTADLDFYFLSGPFSGLELRSDNPFKPCHRGLDQRPAMIPTLLFPLFPTDFSHAGYSLIARLDMPVTSVAFFDLGRITWRNDRFDGRLLCRGRIGQQPMDMPLIIRAIGIASLDRRIDLPQERFELSGIRRIGLR